MRSTILLTWLAVLAGFEDPSIGDSSGQYTTVANHVTTRFSNIELELFVITKKDAGIRVTIFSPKQEPDALIIFDEKELYLSSKDGVHPEVTTKLSGLEAAENLFQMLALNPWIHFPEGKLKHECPVLEDYTIVFDYTLENEIFKPIEMRLYQIDPMKDKLVSTIRFVEFFSSSANLFQPKILQVIDHRKQISGEVFVKNFTYNLSLSDFLFDAQKASGSHLNKP